MAGPTSASATLAVQHLSRLALPAWPRTPAVRPLRQRAAGGYSGLLCSKHTYGRNLLHASHGTAACSPLYPPAARRLSGPTAGVHAHAGRASMHADADIQIWLYGLAFKQSQTHAGNWQLPTEVTVFACCKAGNPGPDCSACTYIAASYVPHFVTKLLQSGFNLKITFFNFSGSKHSCVPAHRLWLLQ